MRYITKLIMLLILSLSIILSSCIQTSFLSEKEKDIDRIKKEILDQKDKYITVGSRNCEFNSIKLALKSIDSKRNIIYIMDKVHTETSIIIENDVVIKGFGDNNSIIQGASNVELAEDRIFLVKDDGKLKLDGLTIQNGRVNKTPRGGGGILNYGKLIVNNCIIRNNIATYGVGIFSNNYLNIKNSSIIGNKSIPRPPDEERLGKGCKGSGGGIKVENGEANIENCIVTDNYSKVTGGGIKISCLAKSTITNCIIANNTSDKYGGGISCNGKMKLMYCTITSNNSHRGGGVNITGDVEIIANIITNNEYLDIDIMNIPNFSPEILRNEYNIIGNGEIEGFISGDINLKEILDRDGNLLTYSLEPKSIAIDAIPSNILFTETDHRGEIRNDGLNDIGAYEYNEESMQVSSFILMLVSGLLFILLTYYFYKHYKTSK